MGWSYNKLWIMLINKNLKRTDLIKLAGINSNAIAHMGKNEPVAMVALGKICQALDCKIEDIVEYIPASKPAPEAKAEAKTETEVEAETQNEIEDKPEFEIEYDPEDNLDFNIDTSFLNSET